jgi:putative tryptophan/tyrosine transport system substrate-binding protein
VRWRFFRSSRAQPSSKVYRLGYLAGVRLPHLIEALQAGLRELGYVEGKNLKVEYRFGGDQLETLHKLALELVALGPDAIVINTTPAAIAAKRATARIPIVMSLVADPVRSGIVDSLAHPGSNITGVTLYGSELSGKRVEVLKEAVLGVAHLAVLGHRTNSISQYTWEETREAARALAIEPQLFMVQELGELDAAFGAMQRSGADAAIVLLDAIFFSARREISVLPAAHHLPAMYEAREFPDDGGLISYGPNFVEMTRRSAALVDKVLKGAKPADLPIEQPTKFELVINLKTAKVLGLTIPPSLLARADEVIE